MIGRVDFAIDGWVVSAALAEDGRWRFAPTEFPLANIIVPAFRELSRDDPGPALGVYGPPQLAAAARLVGGEFTITPKIPTVDDPTTAVVSRYLRASLPGSAPPIF